MSQSIERLKELLFDTEAQALQTLSRKVDAIAELDSQGRDALKQRIDEVFAKVGTGEQLTASISDVLAAALRRAEIAQHVELSRSLAPLVVATIRTELRGSQDEMVEALYPITGRLVKAYVASAIKDLTDEINRRLEQNPIMLRLQSLATGRSVGELALAGTQDFGLDEIYMIRRGSGELIAHWPDAPLDGRQHALSGVLAAINEFASEAFAADQSSLRQIDLGSQAVYLRASALYLLAARCSGTAPARIEQIIDDAFLATVERQTDIDHDTSDASSAAARNAAALSKLGQILQSQIADEKAARRASPRGGALKMLVTIVVLPLVAWFAFNWYSEFADGRVRRAAERVIASVPQMQGYPTNLDVSTHGRKLVVSGLAPSPETKNLIDRQLNETLPGTVVHDRLTVVAGSGKGIPDLTPELTKVRADITSLERNVVLGIEAASAKRATDRSIARARQAHLDLERASADASGLMDAKAIADAKTDVSVLLTDFAGVRTSTDAITDDTSSTAAITSMLALATRTRAVAEKLAQAGSIGPRDLTPQQSEIAAQPASLGSAAEVLAAETERLATFASTFVYASTLRPPPQPAPPPVLVPQISDRQRLLDWSASKAIFFGNANAYRDPERAERQLQEIAALIKNANILVRVVGYTDEAGGPARNTPLALQRAERVRQDLLSLGVNPTLLAAVGRADNLDLSPSKGFGSPNRRVQFELGFEDEAAP